MVLNNGFSEMTENEMIETGGGGGPSDWFYDAGVAIGKGIANVQNAVSSYYANYDSAAFEKGLSECGAMTGRTNHVR